MSEPPMMRIDTADGPARAEPAREPGDDLASHTEAQFALLEQALRHEGFGEAAELTLNRLRVNCAEQAAALSDLIEEGAQQEADLQQLRVLIRDAPMPILRLDGTLGLRFSNEAARRFLGDAFERNGAAALRRSLSRPQVGRLTAALARSCDPATSEAVAPIHLVFAPEPGIRREARATLLRARKPRPDSPGVWWLVLEPEPEAGAASLGMLRLLLDSLPDPVSVTDVEGRVVVANQAFLRSTGQPESRVLGHPPRDFLPLIEALHDSQLDAKVRATQTGLSLDETRARRDGGGHVIGGWEQRHTEKVPLHDDLGRVVGVVTRSHDITEELRARDLADMVFEQSSDAILLTDADLRVLRVNAAFEQIIGFGFARLSGRPLDGLISHPAPGPAAEAEAGDLAGAGSGLRAALQHKGAWRGEVALRSAEGKTITCWGRITRLADGAGITLGHVAMFADLTPLRQAQADNLRLANFDLLTGLPNRHQLLERIDGWIALAQRSGRGFSLLFLDLDQFKAVNDSLGHEIGDLLLSVIAQRLRAALGEPHFAARIGGDEFVILLGDTGAEAARVLAQGLLARLCEPLDLPGLHQYRPAASVGVACYGADGDSRDVLLRNADLAMYAGKLRRSAVTLYEAAMGAEALHELELRNALVGAVERHELVLHFQPLFRLADRSLCGCEALLRWNRPEHGGLLRPAEFLPVAERTGLLPVLDRWVLERAVTVLGDWRRRGTLPEGFVLSINQTAADLAQPGWAKALALAVARTRGLGGAQGPGQPLGLQIELTEDQLAHGVPGAVETLSQLSTQGVRLAIDDFGTGYSCLAYLARLPISMLKIDAHFVRGIEADDKSRLIVEAITALARQFGYQTLAEGIETEAEATTLAQLGCELGQGFLLSSGLAQEDFEARFLTSGIPK